MVLDKFIREFVKTFKKVFRKYSILNKLRNKKDILVQRPNMGTELLLQIGLYMSRMYHTLNDVSKFLNLSSDLTLRRKGKLQKILRTLKNKDFFTKEEYYNMYPCSSQSVRIYATPKAHKLKSLIDAFIVINWRSF